VNTNSYTLTDLDSDANYRWRVISMCEETGINNSGYSNLVLFSTANGNRMTHTDVDLGIDLNIYPNPTRGVFNILFIADEIDFFEITIFDPFGKVILYEDKQEFIGEYTKMIDLSEYSRAIYTIQIKTKDSHVVKRIVLE
jgi:hypothetical protein